MQDAEILCRMRADWNQRAGEDANYYVAFGRRDQDEAEFFATAADVVRLLTAELKRLKSREAALEIGCGPGRLMRPLSRHFAEIHGVDISDEMIRLARERLRDVPNAHPHHGTGSDLALFPDKQFDFVYSYAVFQHIPSRDVVFQYLREAYRVLKPGGILRCQINGLPAHARQYDTWNGVRIAPEEITEFTRTQSFQLLALEQIWTQYMWITCRKPSADVLQPAADKASCTLTRITNAHTNEAAAPATGPLAVLSLLIADLPGACDLNCMSVSADGRVCRVIYIGERGRDGISQVNAALPEDVRTGLVPVEVFWLGQSICKRTVRVIPPGASVPRITGVTDGINLLSGTRIISGAMKVSMSDVTHPEQFRVSLNGIQLADIDWFCIDPIAQNYEFNARLPHGIGNGRHEVRISLGRRSFAPVTIEIVQ